MSTDGAEDFGADASVVGRVFFSGSLEPETGFVCGFGLGKDAR